MFVETYLVMANKLYSFSSYLQQNLSLQTMIARSCHRLRSQQVQLNHHLPLSMVNCNHFQKASKISSTSDKSTVFSSELPLNSKESCPLTREELNLLYRQISIDDSLQQYENKIEERGDIQVRLQTLSKLFLQVKELKSMEKDRGLKREISRIQNMFLELEKDLVSY